jgi:hypothetical protein
MFLKIHAARNNIYIALGYSMNRHVVFNAFIRNKLSYPLIIILFACVLCSAGAINLAVLDLDADAITPGEARTLTNKLRNELLKTGKYNVLERSKMEEILKEQGFQQSGCVSTQCAVEAGQLLGVTHIAAGSIGKIGNIFYISLRLINVSTGQIYKTTEQEVEGKIEYLLQYGMQLVANKISGIETPNEGNISRKLSADEAYLAFSGCKGVQLFLDDAYLGESPGIVVTKPGNHSISVCSTEKKAGIEKTLDDFEHIKWKEYYYQDMKPGNGEPSEAWFEINKVLMKRKYDQCKNNTKRINIAKGDTLFTTISCDVTDTILSIDRTSK